ncbi:MAG: hypothetical protein PF442_06075 [Desulfobulbaceae bacterium]|jgi:hypothetical protein|nr:hypothetical protein [Desulfobulbaceae bacterium]
MQKSHFPYHIFFTLLIVCGATTFFAANTVSVTKHTTPAEMITPFPAALQLDTGELQVATAEQLQKLQLPDPGNATRMVPDYLLNGDFFKNGIMAPKAITGKSITNGHSIHIPTDYTAQISGIQLDSTTQEITLTYVNNAEEDQIITTIYDATQTEITPKVQFIKQVLTWKAVFMNGMMLSLILAFLICKRRMKTLPSAP